MKHLLLSLTLILSANAWADDEFPIELTCEVASEIWYFYFEEQKENSWYKPHESNPNFGGAGNWKNYKGKQNEFGIDPDLKPSLGSFSIPLNLLRLLASISLNSAVRIFSSICFLFFTSIFLSFAW